MNNELIYGVFRNNKYNKLEKFNGGSTMINNLINVYENEEEIHIEMGCRRGGKIANINILYTDLFLKEM